MRFFPSKPVLLFALMSSASACSSSGEGGSPNNGGQNSGLAGSPGGGNSGGAVNAGGASSGAPGTGGASGSPAQPQAGTAGSGGTPMNTGGAASGAPGGGQGGGNSAGNNGMSGAAGASGGSTNTAGSAGQGGATGGSAGFGGAGGSGGTGGATGGMNTGGSFTQPTDPCAPRAGYRNLFTEVLGKSQAEVDAKVAAGFEQLFHGKSNNIYYEVGSDEAYVLDVNNNDVRSEGQSYGMTITVQLDKKAEFDRIWKWTRRVMYTSSGSLAGYFAWKATSGGQVTGGPSAPDGEEYIAMALILASKRWGNGTGIYNYGGEAQALLDALTTKGNFNRSNYLVTFGPTGGSSYTDPSYMLPAFYEVWACFDSKNRAFWRSAVTAARQFMQKTTHPTTGLAPYLANFNATPYADGPDYNSDSWRVVGNIMMDHHLFNADPWQATFATKHAAFFKPLLDDRPFPDEFRLDGTPKVFHDDPAKGLIAQLALLGFGLPAAEGAEFVKLLWDMEVPTGQYRYYDGVLYLLSMLHVSGKFRIE